MGGCSRSRPISPTSGGSRTRQRFMASGARAERITLSVVATATVPTAIRRERLFRTAFLVSVVAIVTASVATGVVLWQNHARDSVTFRGRQYVNPRVVTRREAARHESLVDAHVQLRGMDVLLRASQSTAATPTVLLLRRGDGRYVVYSLSGGP